MPVLSRSSRTVAVAWDVMEPPGAVPKMSAFMVSSTSGFTHPQSGELSYPSPMASTHFVALFVSSPCVPGGGSALSP